MSLCVLTKTQLITPIKPFGHVYNCDWVGIPTPVSTHNGSALDHGDGGTNRAKSKPPPLIVSQAPCAPRRIHSDTLVIAEHSKAITSITFTGLTDTAGWLRVLVRSHTQPRSPNGEHVAWPIFSCLSGTEPSYSWEWRSDLYILIFHLGVFLYTMAGKSLVWQCQGWVRLTITACLCAITHMCHF